MNKSEITLKEYFESRLNALEKATTIVANGLEKATTIAAAGMDKRLEGMNEFREQLRDQTSTFITRNEHEIIVLRITEDIKNIKAFDASFFTRAEHQIYREKTENDIRILRESKATLDGKASQLSTNIALILAIAGLLISLGGLINSNLFSQPNSTPIQLPITYVVPQSLSSVK